MHALVFHWIGRTARTALMSVRFTQVQIQRSANLNAEDYPPSIGLYAVEVQEVNPPVGQVAVHWRLMTTHVVATLKQALQILQLINRKTHIPRPLCPGRFGLWLDWADGLVIVPRPHLVCPP